MEYMKCHHIVLYNGCRFDLDFYSGNRSTIFQKVLVGWTSEYWIIQWNFSKFLFLFREIFSCGKFVFFQIFLNTKVINEIFDLKEEEVEDKYFKETEIGNEKNIEFSRGILLMKNQSVLGLFLYTDLNELRINKASRKKIKSKCIDSWNKSICIVKYHKIVRCL